MPIDMTLPVYLTKEDFVYIPPPQMPEPIPTSCLRFGHSLCVGREDGGALVRRDGIKTKKQVTFADHKGLPLTQVKVFSEFNDPIDIPLNVRQMPSTALSRVAGEDKLVLDFPQPSSDYLLFRQSLETQLVRLEHCVLKERVFAGTVKVKNVSFEKSVRLRVTFDAWASHADIDCVYVKDAYPSSYSDTFSFEVSLPAKLQPHRHVQFAICYEVGGREYWDSNHGVNYGIVWSSVKRCQEDVCGRRSDSYDLGIHFDRYGSPTCSHGVFPDWPSYAGYENIGPYY